MLTASDEDSDLFAAVEAGACGYMLKSLGSDEFLDMLAGVEQGEAAMTRQTTNRLLLGLARRSEPAAAAVPLTAREAELLGLLASGLSNKAIAKKMSLSENTVKYHLKNILQKLHVHNRTEAAAYAIRTHL
jgi:DNA-binding NarL/FixJ family response regulator